MPFQRFNARIEMLPSSIWTKIAQIDELKGEWVGGVHLAPQILNYPLSTFESLFF